MEISEGLCRLDHTHSKPINTYVYVTLRWLDEIIKLSSFDTCLQIRYRLTHTYAYWDNIWHQEPCLNLTLVMSHPQFT